MIPTKFVHSININPKYQNLDEKEATMPSKKLPHSYKLVDRNDRTIGAANCCSVSWFVILTCSAISLFLVYINSSVFSVDNSISIDSLKSQEIPIPPDVKVEKLGGCVGKYIYVLDLPSMFNSEIVKNCSVLSPWTDMCKLLNNSGMGNKLNRSDEGVFSGSSWYATDQFSLEILFRNRLKQYRCLTDDYKKASAVYVHYYPGLDVGRYLWNHTTAERDALALKFVDYIKHRPEWKRFGGRDHFLVLGRITWDFRRSSDDATNGSEWGNRLSHFPEVKNMTNLVIEASPNSKAEIGIPYPTFFHPSSDREVHDWQEKMRQKKRPFLFSFAGAARPHLKESIRNDIIKQCSEAKECKFMNCNPDVTDCSKPQTVMRLFQSSAFCLQPPGDSYTRKSVFDTILAGCIPVLLHPASAYVQYLWHLPKNYSKYSVFIPMDEVKNGTLSIEKKLLEIPKEQIKAMREEVIRLIPRIVYANPNSKLDTMEDAVDVAIKGVLERVKMIKKAIKSGKNSTYESVPEDEAWKYNFFGNLKNDEWDKYFGDNFGIQ